MSSSEFDFLRSKICELDTQKILQVQIDPDEDADGDSIIRVWVILRQEINQLSATDKIRWQIRKLFREFGSTQWVHVRFLDAKEASIESGLDVTTC